MNQQNMRDRRSFLRLSAGAIGVGMLPGCSGTDAAETDAASSTGATGASSGGPGESSGEPIPTTGEPTATGTSEATPETGTEAGTSSSGTDGDTDPAGPLPAWLDGRPLNEWFPIDDTAGAGGAQVDTYSGFALRVTELWCLACGGHGPTDNRVTSIDLADDAPSWALRHAPSAARDLVDDQPYNADGLPTSRHTYRHNIWVPELNRLMMFGCRGTSPNAHHYFTVDGFDPDTDKWDPAGTWPTIPDGAGFGQVRDGAGQVWTQGWHRFDPATVSWTDPGITHEGVSLSRSPTTYDPVRDQIVCVQWGDGFGSGTGVNAVRMPLSGTTRKDITFNASAALTQFITDASLYGAMDHCPDNDKFLWYSGTGNGVGRFYWISPNAGEAWDIEIAVFGPNSAAPLPATPSAGCNGKLAYVAALKGFVLLPHEGAPLYFLRTA